MCTMLARIRMTSVKRRTRSRKEYSDIREFAGKDKPADFSTLVRNWVVQGVGANIAPEVIKSGFVSDRASTHDFINPLTSA